MSDRISAIGDGDFEPNTQSAELVEAVQAIQQKQRPVERASEKEANEEVVMVGDLAINEQIEALNQKLMLHNNYAKYSVHEGTNQIMIKIIDKETDEVIKELPPEKLLDMAAQVWERFGLMVDKKA